MISKEPSKCVLTGLWWRFPCGWTDGMGGSDAGVPKPWNGAIIQEQEFCGENDRKSWREGWSCVSACTSYWSPWTCGRRNPTSTLRRNSCTKMAGHSRREEVKINRAIDLLVTVSDVDEARGNEDSRTNRRKWRRRRSREEEKQGGGEDLKAHEQPGEFSEIMSTQPNQAMYTTTGRSRVSNNPHTHVYSILTTLQAKGPLHLVAVCIYGTMLAPVGTTSTLTHLMDFTGRTISYLGIIQAPFMWQAVQYFCPSTPVSILWYGCFPPPVPSDR